MKRPGHLFSSWDGALYDTRVPDWSTKPLRATYRHHHSRITTPHEMKATLRAGPTTDMGGYPLYLMCDDGAPLCFPCAKGNLRQILPDIRNGHNSGWRVVACDINYEDHDMHCAHCNKQIEPAYGRD